jgi:hypothetical protein
MKYPQKWGGINGVFSLNLKFPPFLGGCFKKKDSVGIVSFWIFASKTKSKK